MNSKDSMYAALRELNLSDEEAKVYITLLEKPNTQLQVSRITGINRTKVYRLIEQLEARSLVLRRTDDRGTFLLANDPRVLEIELAAREEKTKRQRQVFERALPVLQSFHAEQTSPFAVQAYEGIEGFKQMQWNELKTKDELLVLGNMTVEELVVNRHWAENVRKKAAERGYRTRELINRPYDEPVFSGVSEFMELYEARFIPEAELPVSTPMVIYNDTVAIYQFDSDKRVGVEVINPAYATTMRSIFEHYWRQGTLRP
jgi:sugar-specific transcriptional regulator TrmB